MRPVFGKSKNMRVPHPKRSLIALRVGYRQSQRPPQTQGIRNGVQLGVWIATVPIRAGAKAAGRSYFDKSAVLRHADNPGRRSRYRDLRASVFTKEDEAYHIRRSNLNALHHMGTGFTRFHRTPRAILFPAMKVAFGIVVLALVVLSLIADYKWKQWITARKQERDQQK